MSLYLVPEMRVPNGEIINVIGKEEKPVGFLSVLFDKEDDRMYVYGCLKELGVEVEFIDVIEPYIRGLSESLKIKEVSAYVCKGGKERQLFCDDEEKEKKSE